MMRCSGCVRSPGGRSSLHLAGNRRRSTCIRARTGPRPLSCDLTRTATVLDRIAGDAGELARAGSRISRLRRRRWLAEPDLGFATFCRAKRMSSAGGPQLERGRDAWQARDTAAARPTGTPSTPTIHPAVVDPPSPVPVSVEDVNRFPCSETGRRSGACGQVLTGTPSCLVRPAGLAWSARAGYPATSRCAVLTRPVTQRLRQGRPHVRHPANPRRGRRHRRCHHRSVRRREALAVSDPSQGRRSLAPRAGHSRSPRPAAGASGNARSSDHRPSASAVWPQARASSRPVRRG
jgi:hypothetical protein